MAEMFRANKTECVEDPMARTNLKGNVWSTMFTPLLSTKFYIQIFCLISLVTDDS